MSSLTTAGSSMEECSADTRLSLEIGGGETSRPQRQTTAVRLFGELISPQDHGVGEHREPTTMVVGSRKRRAERAGVSAAVSSAAGGSRHQNKKQATIVRTSLQEEEGGNNRRISPSDGSSSRKKLRLTAAQATMLEDTFRAHNILSHGQKHELARRAGLSARQVEVWFQNRRARTKLKQTEVDCDLLRRWCDRLTDENARLRRDLAELRAARLPSAAVSVVCPTCCDKQVQMAVAAAGDVALH